MNASVMNPKVIAVAGDAFGVVEKLVSGYWELRAIGEQEATKRQAIQANCDLELKRIRADRDIFLKYLDRSFDERKENFTYLFGLADSALAKGDNTQLAEVLKSVVALAAESPFKALSEIGATRDALRDRTRSWDV